MMGIRKGDIFQELNSYTEKIKQEKSSSGAALLIMKDDKIVHEWYSGYHHFGNEARKIDSLSRFNVYSVRVTYISLAISIAAQEGYLSLDDKICDYLLEYDQDLLGETTIRHLLSRSSGLKFANKEVRRLFELGTNIEGKGKNPDIIAKILYKATGKSVSELLTERVFKPLNWTSTSWVTEGDNRLVCDIHSPDHHATLRIGSNRGDERNLYVNARELAFWGNLHLNKGKVRGKQVLPGKVFDRVTSIQSPVAWPNDLPKFGSFWWVKDGEVRYPYNELGAHIPKGSYQILGASGCSCLVIPQYNAVAVRMYNRLYTNDLSTFNYIDDIHKFGSLIVSSLNKLAASD
ncbi:MULTISPECIES: serine hydrolase domain-containing protein [Sporosarcina]|uniref:Serine hydrolase domain-containing protein n=1 Tax=Sporosarcina contaminans TaxID=633403 RepID=A0ABW3TYC2_9BACL